MLKLKNMRKKDQKPFSFRLLRDEMGLKSRDPKKARLGSTINVIPNFSFLAQFGGELFEEQTQKMKKMRKPDQKTIFLGL